MHNKVQYTRMYQNGGGFFSTLLGLFGGKKRTTYGGRDTGNMGSTSPGGGADIDTTPGSNSSGGTNSNLSPDKPKGFFSGMTTQSVASGLGGIGSAVNQGFAAGNISNPYAKQAGVGDAIEGGVSSALGMLGPWGAVAGTALNLVNGIGGSLMNGNSTAKAANNFKLNNDVMQSSSYGGITSGAEDAMTGGQAYKKAGLFGKLFTNTEGLKSSFSASNAQQKQAAGILQNNKNALDRAATGVDTNNNNLLQKYYNSDMWNNGSVTYGKEGMVIGKSGIHIKKSHEGRFTAYKKRTGQTTEEALHSSDPHVRKMANFARNAAKWHHQDGGKVGEVLPRKRMNRDLYGDMTASRHQLGGKIGTHVGAALSGHIGVPHVTPQMPHGTGSEFARPIENKVQNLVDKNASKDQQIAYATKLAQGSDQNQPTPSFDFSQDVMDMVNQALSPGQAAQQAAQQSVAAANNPAVSVPIDPAALPAMQDGGTMSTSGSDGVTMTTAKAKKLAIPTVVIHKDGGAVNVIAEGEFHSRKHDLKSLPHLEDASMTEKGIPVVSYEDNGDVTQHAEVEKNELILHYDLTKQLESLHKEGTDDAACEAGKLLAKEIVKNTKDSKSKILVNA